MAPALLLAASAPRTVSAAPPASNHQEATAAFSDLNAAIAQIVGANRSFSTNRSVYYRASQRAINALEGAHSSYYVAGAGNPGDAAGALGHLDRLLHRAAATPVWEAPLDGVEANIRGAVAHLLDANHSHSFIRFALASSRALAYLEVARGRSTQLGALGGIEGALANTVLGVPDGAATQDACAAPSSAPSYGVHGGYLAWVAVPAKAGVHRLAVNPGGTSIIVRNGVIELPTAAAGVVAKACASHASNDAPTGATHASTTQDPPLSQGATGADPPPKLYTKAQAEAGKPVFATNCVVCHGANLQGTAAPSVAGKDFLTAAHNNHWTVQIMRYIIFNNMPKNEPHSLSPEQYTNVLAYLLASSCYPAGNRPLPQTAGPKEAKVQLEIVPGSHPGRNKYGVCPVT